MVQWFSGSFFMGPRWEWECGRIGGGLLLPVLWYELVWSEPCIHACYVLANNGFNGYGDVEAGTILNMPFSVVDSFDGVREYLARFINTKANKHSGIVRI